MHEWEDRALWAMKTMVWYCYDDNSTHRLEGERALTREGKTNFARMILFLQTNRRYEWRRYDFIPLLEWIVDRVTFGWWGRRLEKKGEKIDWEIWPFRRVEDFEQAKIRPR